MLHPDPSIIQPEVKMPKWYYAKKEIKENPSVTNGMDPMVESRYRREGARFIMELGTAMNLSLQSTMATAVVFFHRFYMKHTFQDFPRYPTACACLFLAGKVEETPKKCRDMIDNAKKLLGDPKFTQQFGTDIRTQFEEVMTLERILLQSIKFDLQLEHPYKFLLKYAQSLKGDKARLERMVQMAWNFVNDSLCTTLCLQWEPEIIAIALMYLACKLSKFEVHDWNGRVSEHLRWWDMYVEDMGIEVLEDICHQVLDFYSQVKSPDSNSGGGTPTTTGSNLGTPVSNSAKISPTQPQGSPGVNQLQQQPYPVRNVGGPISVPPPFTAHPPPPSMVAAPGQPTMPPFGYPVPMPGQNHVGMMPVLHHRPMLPTHLQPPPPLPHVSHYPPHPGVPPPPLHPGGAPLPPPQQPQPPLPPGR